MAFLRCVVFVRNQQIFPVGTDIRFDAYFYDINDALIALAALPQIVVTKPDGSSYLAATNMIAESDTGHYSYDMQTVTTDVAGTYKVNVRGVSGGQTTYTRADVKFRT